jgi:hypothetical protein
MIRLSLKTFKNPLSGLQSMSPYCAAGAENRLQVDVDWGRDHSMVDKQCDGSVGPL